MDKTYLSTSRSKKTGAILPLSICVCLFIHASLDAVAADIAAGLDIALDIVAGHIAAGADIALDIIAVDISSSLHIALDLITIHGAAGIDISLDFSADQIAVTQNIQRRPVPMNFQLFADFPIRHRFSAPENFQPKLVILRIAGHKGRRRRSSKQFIQSDFENVRNLGQQGNIRAALLRFPFAHRLVGDPQLLGQGLLGHIYFSSVQTDLRT